MTLEELETRLRDTSHNTDALKLIREFSSSLGKTKARQSVFNAEGALVTYPPIDYAMAVTAEIISPEEDAFTLLQGDIVQTDAAYFMGERLTGMKFVVANSTCDLVPGRRKYAALLPIHPIRLPDNGDSKKVKADLSTLLEFKSTREMYLPPLDFDEEDVVGNAVQFDGLAQVLLADLLLAHRIASLSLVGWRIFATHLRSILARAGDSEVQLRSRWFECDLPE